MRNTPPMTVARGAWWTVRAAGADETTEVLVYGDIGPSFWGEESIEARAFVEQLEAIATPRITVRINSYGGIVADAIAIHNALRRHDAAITVAIDGVAVSAASLIAMAGDEVEIAANGLVMVHAPWSMAAGNAADMRRAADVLDKYAEAMASSYERKTGRSNDEVMDLLTDDEDHWFTAQEALDWGLVDRVADADADLDVAAHLRQSRFTLPAAVAAMFKMEANSMAPPTPAPAAAPAPAPSGQTGAGSTLPASNPDEIRAAALAADQARRTGIRAAFEPFARHDGVAELREQCCDDVQCSVEAARDRLLAKLGEGTQPVASRAHIESGETAAEKFVRGAASALQIRSGQRPDDDAGNQFRGYTLSELARASLASHGMDTGGLDRRELVAVAFTHTSGDFGNLLANTARKSMLRGWEEAQETYQAWTNRGVLTDFKVTDRVDLNLYPSLASVPEGAEYKHGTMGDRKEQIQLATYGSLFGITRQAIINDDLMAFTRVPERMGRAARRTIGNLVYAVLTSNPTMADSVALFHANHSNLLTGAALSTASVDAMRVAMARQKDPGSANNLNIRLGYIIVPVTLEGAAKVVAESEYEVGASTRNNTTPNSVRNTFEVISDARLDDASVAAWFGAASPAMHDTVEVAYLDGDDTPFLDQMEGWSRDGTSFKVRIDAAVKALDFRTLAKNPGP